MYKYIHIYIHIYICIYIYWEGSVMIHESKLTVALGKKGFSQNTRASAGAEAGAGSCS